MTESHPKSRFPRTGTLVLIAVVLLIGGGALMVWLPYHRNQTAMAEVERLGGFVERGIFRPIWIPDTVDDEYLAVFERVWYVHLSDTSITDVGLAHLQGLNSLNGLLLDKTEVSDAGLENLRGLTNLKWLILDSTQVGDVGLEHLRGLTNLTDLELYNTQVGDAGLEHLQGLTNLQTLHLGNTEVSDAGLEHLRGFTKLEQLWLENTHVTQAGIDKLDKALPDCLLIWTPPSE